MTQEVAPEKNRIYRPGWGHALKVWWWWAWRTVLCSIAGGSVWALLVVNAFPADVQATAVIAGGYLWGIASSVYFIKRLFTDCRFYDFCPALIRD